MNTRATIPRSAHLTLVPLVQASEADRAESFSDFFETIHD